jgi:type VI protein secretion system component VasK
MQEAAGLAQSLSAELARLSPGGDEALSPEQRQRARGTADRQDSVGQRTEELAREVGKRQGQIPGADRAGSELQGIAGQMHQAGRDLRQSAAKQGAGRAQDAAERLAKLRDSMGQGASGNSRAHRDPVRIPGADEYRAPREWRQELLDAMREKAPERFRDEVRRYYEELVR